MVLLIIAMAGIVAIVGSVPYTQAAVAQLTDTMCTQPELMGQYMCVMNGGLSQDRTYSNEVLLAGRGGSTLSNFLQPDMTVHASYTTKTLMSSLTSTATAYVDIFLCSDDTCNNYVDIQYVKNKTSNITVGFRVGAIPNTQIAIGVPLPYDNTAVNNYSADTEVDFITSAYREVYDISYKNATEANNYAILGTRVNFEAYTDYILGNTSIGFAPYLMDGVCTYVMYPNNAWYQQQVIRYFESCTDAEQTFAVMGVHDNTTCQFCDNDSVYVTNSFAPCYPSGCYNCQKQPYQNVNFNIGKWLIKAYNLTSNAQADVPIGQPPGTGLYFTDQQTSVNNDYPWSTVFMEIIAEARSAIPSGCNTLDKFEFFVLSNDDCNVENYSCQSVEGTVNSANNSYGTLLQHVQTYWVTTLQETFSMLGYERISTSRMQPEIDAVEEWSYQQASLSAKVPVIPSSFFFNTKGYIITYLVNVTAAIGAWSAYSDISKWISRIISCGGRAIAGTLTMFITLLPFFIVVVTDYSVNRDHEQSVVYKQQAFDAAGYGQYKIVAIAQINENPQASYLSLYLGIPLAITIVIIGLIAIALTEHTKRAQPKKDEQQTEAQDARLLSKGRERSSDVPPLRDVRRTPSKKSDKEAV